MKRYFQDEFIPYLTQNKDDNDILVHLGNVTSKIKSINLEVLKFVQDIFQQISDILPVYIIAGENDAHLNSILRNFPNIEVITKPKEVEILLLQKFAMLPFGTKFDEIDKYESDYCFFNFEINTLEKENIAEKLSKFKKCYGGFYDKNFVFKNIKFLGAPYNLENSDKRGFIELETYTDTDKFLINKTSPSFKKLTINNHEDLNFDKSILSNNYVSLTINKKLFVDSKLKIEMLLSENEFLNINYIDDEIQDSDIIELNGESVSLVNMIEEYIKKSELDDKERLLEEFQKIKKIHDT